MKKPRTEEVRKVESLAVQRRSMSDDELLEIVTQACFDFEGDCSILEAALGALCWGRVVGWQGLRLMHTSRTFKRYEDILGIKFRDVLPPRTAHSMRMNGINMADKLGKFWQVITAGQVSAKDARDVKVM